MGHACNVVQQITERNIMFKLWEKWQRHALGVSNMQLGNGYGDEIFDTVVPVTVVCTKCCTSFEIGEDGHECTVLDITNG